MLTEGKVRAIAFSVAAALIRKVKPDISEEQIKSAVEDVIRQMKESGELTGGTVTDEQIASAVEAYLLKHPIESPGAAESAEQAKNAAEAAEASNTAAAGSATTASNAATEAQTAQGKAETAQKAAESARDTAAQKATDATNAAKTATEAMSEAETAMKKAETARDQAWQSASAAEAAAGSAAATVGSIPTALPNPKSLIINGTAYDGSKEVKLQLDDTNIIESVDDLPTAGEDYKDIYYAIKGAENTDGSVPGDIYWCVFRKSHTNRLPEAQPLASEVSALSGTHTFINGYWPGVRISGGDGTYRADGTANVTGLIPAKPGQTVRMRHVLMDRVDVPGEGNGGLVLFYEDNKAYTDIIESKHKQYSSNSATFVQLLDNGDYTFTIPTTSEYAGTEYIRVQFSVRTPNPADIIIVVDEEIKDYETGWHWEDTGIDKSLGNDSALLKLTKRVAALEEGDSTASGSNDLPVYWAEHLDSKIATIKEHLANGGRNAFAYVVMTDLHAPQQRALYTGKLARRIMDECGITVALDLGDHTSRGYIASKEVSDEQFNACDDLLASIAAETLRTPGNHDGTVVIDSSSTIYYSPAEVLDRVYGGMRLDKPAVWDDAGSGYYCDDRAHRVRFVMLNTSARGDFSGDLVPNGGYTQFRYTQYQYDLVKEALSTLPNDRWRVVVASHVPPVRSVDRFGDGLSVSDLSGRFPDAPQMRQLLAAYVNRATASISYTETSYPYGSAQMTADFSAAKGRLLLYHAGHFHVDLLWPAGAVCDTSVGDSLAFPIVGHRCDSFNETQGSSSPIEAALVAERVAGTATEHSFDVVIIDPENNTAHMVKIGAGEDRTASLSN